MSTGLWQTWERTVADAPDAPAVIDAGAGGTSLSRRGLLERAARLAAAWGKTGGSPRGRTVAFAEGNGSRWLEIFLALQRAGSIALPLDASLPVARRTPVATGLGADFLLDADGVEPFLVPLPGGSAAGDDGDLCLVKLTSGTSGAPRPLAFTSENMLADGRQICATMGIGPEDRNLGVVPFGHSYGLGNLVLPLLLQGTAVVATTEMLPAALAEAVARFGVSVLPTVPAILRALAEAELPPARLAGLRRVISAGAFLRPETARAFVEKFDRRVHNFYGSSETGGICFDRDGEATLTGRAVGRPLEGVRVELDAAAGGQVRVSSPAVAHPGTHGLADRGTWNERGELCLHGRVAATVANIGGKKVDPAEIERQLRALAGITDAWVAVRARDGGAGGRGDDFLVAVVETNLGRAAVRAALSARLPGWQVPRQLWTLARLPRTERGKLDRQRLEELAAGR